MVSNESYTKTEIEFDKFSFGGENEGKNNNVWCTSVNYRISEERAYSYDEALELAGNGWYNMGLVVSLSIGLLAMSIDMFSFSIIVSLSSCDFQLNLNQQSVLLSMPFLGPIAMAYAWGYISDTRGRRKSLLVAMSVSFLVTVISAFSPNWIMLAICKLIGTCCCSCAQSASYALLGESCVDRVKGRYMIGMTSIIHTSLGLYFTISYFVVNLDFSHDLGFITFVPWRLLVLILALPLGLSAASLIFFYESPKFLLNAGHEDQALELLRRISRRNGVKEFKYPVNKLVLTEVGNLRHKGISLLESMWEQTVPLFKPPLLYKTMLIYYLIVVIFISSNSLFVWLPFLAESFSEGISSSGEALGMCGIISKTFNASSDTASMTCSKPVELPIVFFTLAASTFYCIVNSLMSKLASRKKILNIVINFISSACCIGTVVIPNNVVSIVLYFGVICNSLCMGLVFSYCVDLYPTSFRGMVACLGVMVARLSSIAGVNLVGPYIMTHCTTVFYTLGALVFSGAVVSCFLPSDRPKSI